MSKRDLFAVGALATVYASFVLGQAPDLPPGKMQANARTACMECHESRIILEQRLSKPAWIREVDKMIKWGAVVDPKDREVLIDYLSANFPPEKPAGPTLRVAKGR